MINVRHMTSPNLQLKICLSIVCVCLLVKEGAKISPKTFAERNANFTNCKTLEWYNESYIGLRFRVCIWMWIWYLSFFCLCPIAGRSIILRMISLLSSSDCSEQSGFWTKPTHAHTLRHNHELIQVTIATRNPYYSRNLIVHEQTSQ